MLAAAGLEAIRDDLPLGYAPASATRTLEAGVETGITVTFRRLDTDAAGPPLTLHRGTGDAGPTTAPDQVRVAIGSGRGVFTPSTSVLTWSDGGSSWSLQGDVDLARLVAIASAIRRQVP